MLEVAVEMLDEPRRDIGVFLFRIALLVGIFRRVEKAAVHQVVADIAAVITPL